MSLRVFDPNGRFHPVGEDLDFSPLEPLFREQTFKVMLEKEATSQERVQMLRSWQNTGSSPRGDRGGRTLHVDASRRVASEDRPGLESLLVTMERGPVSLERLTCRKDEGLVHYRGKLHPSLGRDHPLLPPVDFLALLVPHGLLRLQSAS